MGCAMRPPRKPTGGKRPASPSGPKTGQRTPARSGPRTDQRPPGAPPLSRRDQRAAGWSDRRERTARDGAQGGGGGGGSGIGRGGGSGNGRGGGRAAGGNGQVSRRLGRLGLRLRGGSHRLRQVRAKIAHAVRAEMPVARKPEVDSFVEDVADGSA
jgi:hypothetical protein